MTTEARRIVTLQAVVRSLRPHQWVKNSLVFVPVLLSGKMQDAEAWLLTGAGFLAISATSSAGYLINDLYDLRQDRLHRSKRNRALASGAMPKEVALCSWCSLESGS